MHQLMFSIKFYEHIVFKSPSRWPCSPWWQNRPIWARYDLFIFGNIRSTFCSLNSLGSWRRVSLQSLGFSMLDFMLTYLRGIRILWRIYFGYYSDYCGRLTDHRYKSWRHRSPQARRSSQRNRHSSVLPLYRMCFTGKDLNFDIALKIRNPKAYFLRNKTKYRFST